MKAILTLTSLTSILLGLILGAAGGKADTGVTEILEVALPDQLPEEYQALLPARYTVPANLPSTISDPHLLAAWVFLYNQDETITIHDGIELSGRQLAERVLTENISIEWGSDDICWGVSCTMRKACQDWECINQYSDQRASQIYISRQYQKLDKKVFQRLSGALAHELYHQMQVFGPVGTSLYEEYWAYYISVQIAKAYLAEFDGYNPLKAVCLERWFIVYGLSVYQERGDLYPFTLEAEVDLESEICFCQ